MLKHTEMWGTNPISAAHSMLHPTCKYKVNYVRRTQWFRKIWPFLISEMKKSQSFSAFPSGFLLGRCCSKCSTCINRQALIILSCL